MVNGRDTHSSFFELSDGGQIKVVHFDTKICQGDFGCNERSFPDAMQKQWKRITSLVCSSWRCLIESNTGKMHLKDEGFSTIPKRRGVEGGSLSPPKKGKNPPPSLKPSVMQLHCLFSSRNESEFTMQLFQEHMCYCTRELKEIEHLQDYHYTVTMKMFEQILQTFLF